MRPPEALVIASSHNYTVFDEYTTHERIGAHKP